MHLHRLPFDCGRNKFHNSWQLFIIITRLSLMNFQILKTLRIAKASVSANYAYWWICRQQGPMVDLKEVTGSSTKPFKQWTHIKKCGFKSFWCSGKISLLGSSREIFSLLMKEVYATSSVLPRNAWGQAITHKNQHRTHSRHSIGWQVSVFKLTNHSQSNTDQSQVGL